MSRYVFFKGQIVPDEQAVVSVRTHAFNYGTGCFEGIRAYWNEDEKQLFVFRLPEHYQRLLQSASMLFIQVPYSVKELCDLTLELLRREGYREDTYIRPLAYKSGQRVGLSVVGVEDELTIFCQPFGRYLEQEEGARVCVSSWRRNDDNAIPARAKVTGAYINSALAKSEAQFNGFDEAIMLSSDGHVSEGTGMNLFIVRGGRLVTPPITENILEGITRATVMQMAHEVLGLEVVERSIDRTELYAAEEAFFCGTGAQVAAITSIDHRPLGNGKIGPITEKIRNLYFKVVRGNEGRYRGWCMPVYR